MRFLRLVTLVLPLFIFAACGKDDAQPLGLVASPALPPYQELSVDTKLFDHWRKEVRGLTPEQVAALNEATVGGLESAPVAANPREFTPESAKSLHQELYQNIVTSERKKYEQPNTAIGYCFGRAMFVHLRGLQLHYPKRQIKKLWVLGHMDAGGLNWSFHVTTIIRDGNGPWRVVDSYLSAPTTPREWLAVFVKQNKEGNLRLYVTRAEKFTPDLGKYTRAQLGLDLSREEDWYRHYFTDLMATLKLRRTLESPTQNSEN